jgi:hypothetical protein
MADICTVTLKMIEDFDEWKKDRPQVVVDLADKYPPWKLFRMKGSGHRCVPFSYNENGTLSVIVDGRFNRVLFGRTVFGVPPDELEECDLPGPDEDVGDTAQEAGYTEEDVRGILIPKLREKMGSCTHTNCELGGEG